MTPVVLAMLFLQPGKHAGEGGDIDQLERHIYWKSDLNAINAAGNSPLHESAIAGRIVMARLLLKNGANINDTNQQGKTALQLALENGKTELAEVLVKQFKADFDPTALLFRILENQVSHRDVIAFLVQNGADLAAYDENGQTPLTLAVLNGSRLQTKHLVNNQADVNLANRDGLRPLTIATTNNATDIVRLLENHGALGDTQQ